MVPWIARLAKLGLAAPQACLYSRADSQLVVVACNTTRPRESTSPPNLWCRKRSTSRQDCTCGFSLQRQRRQPQPIAMVMTALTRAGGFRSGCSLTVPWTTSNSQSTRPLWWSGSTGLAPPWCQSNTTRPTIRAAPPTPLRCAVVAMFVYISCSSHPRTGIE